MKIFNWICRPFHRWMDWQTYEQTVTGYKNDGLGNNTQVRQFRDCQDCSYRQIRDMK